MKKVVFNKNGLRVEEIMERKRKARAFIIDDKQMVTLCKYHDVYMLPGGKIEDNELSTESLIRELKEELGIPFTLKDLDPLLRTVTMAKNYPIRNSEKTVNRCCQTDYYLIRSNKKIEIHKRNLTASEIEHHFQVEYVPLNRILEVVENHEHYNERNQYFSRELLEVLKEYVIRSNEVVDVSKKTGMIDLHIHTTASDGEKSPNEIVQLAIQNGAQVISITDHDTVSGYDELVYDKSKIQVIPGIELSAFSKVGRLHILGYGFNPMDPVFRNRLQELHQNSINNIFMFVDILKKDYHISFREEDINQLTKLSRNIGRPDLAKLMVRDGIVRSVQEAFDKYLIDANIKISDTLQKPTFQECFQILKDAGGIPVLAHPHSLLLKFPDLVQKIQEMKEYGLKGIEVYHSNTSKDLSEKLVDLAMKENLYITGGSDYHGSIAKPNIQLLTGKNQNIKIKRLQMINDIFK